MPSRHLLPLSLALTFLPVFPAQSQGLAPYAGPEIAPWSAEPTPRLVNPRPLKEFQPIAENDRPVLGVPEPTAPLPISSPLEEMYSSRVVESLEQFGYDLFGAADTNRDGALPAGAAQDDFVLSIGDELSVTMRGQRQAQLTAQINGEGFLIIDDFDPIIAAGRTLGQVREQLESLAAQLYNTTAFLSLTKVNQVNVLVAGHVINPGRKTLTGFDTVLDALNAAGGIEKTGTLRQIKLIRDGRTTVIDLYGLLIYGTDTADLNLRNGDKLMVRPIGPTVAVAGGVKRPGIYEILPALQATWTDPEHKSQRLAANDLLDMAGGVLSIAQNRLFAHGHDIKRCRKRSGHRRPDDPRFWRR